MLRYWESEFPALAPAKNNSGQRIYRRRDIETILRSKRSYTKKGSRSRGRKKKLELEMKEQAKGTSVTSAPQTPTGDDGFKDDVKEIKAELHGLLDMLDRDVKAE